MTTTTTASAAPGPVAAPVSGQRAGVILSRFPRYLEAQDPGKRLGAVVAALATGVDVLTRQVQDVRAARRLGQAPAAGDLLALAALHGLGEDRLFVIERRATALQHASSADPLDASALAGLLNVSAEVLDGLVSDRPDELAAALDRATWHSALMTRRRAVVAGAIAAHTRGNATPAGLLVAAAAYTGLQVLGIRHTADRWWHLATCQDTTLVRVPAGQGGQDPPDLTPQPEIIALEENPFRDAGIEPSPKRHAQRTRILRGGLEDVDVTVRVTGVGQRTVRPMVVHLGAGTGIVYEGEVPDGMELAFGSSGQVQLDGTDVTGSAWTFHGAVFADATRALAPDDFVYTDPSGAMPPSTGEPAAGQPSAFAVTAPVPSAFDLPSGLPHGAAGAGPMRLPRGESRWTVLVRTARTAGADGPAAPRPFAGRFDQSVLAAGPGETNEPCLQLGFAWEEREPFALRMLLPQRLSSLDDDVGSVLREPLRRLLDRHRAAGVSLRVEYADPRWLLGEGVVRTMEDDALGVILAGTQLWPDVPAPDG